MSRNFLCPTSQVELWDGGEESMAYQMTHLPPPPQRLTRKIYKSKNSSNFLSPTIQEFSMSNKVKLSFGMVGGRHMEYQMTHSPTTTSKIDKKILYSPKIQASFLSPKCQEIF